MVSWNQIKEDFDMTLGEKLQYLRKEKGISQEQLAGIFFDACLICAVHKDYEEKKILQAAVQKD